MTFVTSKQDQRAINKWRYVFSLIKAHQTVKYEEILVTMRGHRVFIITQIWSKKHNKIPFFYKRNKWHNLLTPGIFIIKCFCNAATVILVQNLNHIFVSCYEGWLDGRASWQCLINTSHHREREKGGGLYIQNGSSL